MDSIPFKFVVSEQGRMRIGARDTYAATCVLLRVVNTVRRRRRVAGGGLCVLCVRSAERLLLQIQEKCNDAPLRRGRSEREKHLKPILMLSVRWPHKARRRRCRSSSTAPRRGAGALASGGV